MLSSTNNMDTTMNQTQSIILYRNPMEQAFWESGAIVPLLCSIIGAVIVTYFVCTMWDKLSRRFKQGYNMRRHTDKVAMATAVITCLTILWAML